MCEREIGSFKNRVVAVCILYRASFNSGTGFGRRPAAARALIRLSSAALRDDDDDLLRRSAMHSRFSRLCGEPFLTALRTLRCSTFLHFVVVFHSECVRLLCLEDGVAPTVDYFSNCRCLKSPGSSTRFYHFFRDNVYRSRNLRSYFFQNFSHVRGVYSRVLCYANPQLLVFSLWRV